MEGEEEEAGEERRVVEELVPAEAMNSDLPNCDRRHFGHVAFLESKRKKVFFLGTQRVTSNRDSLKITYSKIVEFMLNVESNPFFRDPKILDYGKVGRRTKLYA